MLELRGIPRDELIPSRHWQESAVGLRALQLRPSHC